MLAYTTRETNCEFGYPCRNLHILLILSAQRMSANRSLGSWFYSWSTNTLFIGFVYTYSLLLTTLLQYENTGTVRVLVNFCACAQVQCNLLFLRDAWIAGCKIRRYYTVSVVTIQSASLLSDSLITIRYRFWLVRFR